MIEPYCNKGVCYSLYGESPYKSTGVTSTSPLGQLGAFIGIIIGSVFGLALIVVGSVFGVRKCKKERKGLLQLAGYV